MSKLINLSPTIMEMTCITVYLIWEKVVIVDLDIQLYCDDSCSSSWALMPTNQSKAPLRVGEIARFII